MATRSHQAKKVKMTTALIVINNNANFRTLFKVSQFTYIFPNINSLIQDIQEHKLKIVEQLFLPL